MIAAILVIATVCSLAVPAFAAGEEEYISELRLVYAEDYDEAKAIIAEGEFKEYKVLNENLNENSDEIGVWLAYKTTTNIEDAITDLNLYFGRFCFSYRSYRNGFWSFTALCNCFK